MQDARRAPASHEIIDAFLSAMRDAGLEPDFKRGQGIEFGQTAAGNPQRFRVKGDSAGTLNGWYVVFADGTPAGEFGSWKTGVSHTWCMENISDLSTDEREAMRARLEAAKAERERARRQAEGDAAKAANLLWNDAADVVGDDHPYLKRKGIRSHGLRVTDWPVRTGDGRVVRTIANTLLIPIYNRAGKLTSVQGVFPAVDEFFDRDKTFIAGGRKRGCFYMIGKPPRAGEHLAFCEGYATAESVHQATGWCVVVCWDAYNVPHVADALREEFPEARFTFAADNDQWTEAGVSNPGKTYAERAAAGVGGRVVLPLFTSLDGKPTDFNDLHAREGIEAVQGQVLPSQDIAPAEPAPARDVVGYRNPINPMSIDLATTFSDYDGKGKPLATPTNLAELLQRINGTARYNVISKDIEILIPGLVSSMDNRANSARAELRAWMTRARMPGSEFDGNLTAVADANQYNPVATWIMSKPWDGKSRLQAFYDTVTAETDSTLADGGSLKERLMYRWLMSAVAAAFNPNGVVARGVLTLQSKQNLGKTHWLKRLVPAELEVVADGITLDPSNKDSVKLCVSKWIVELGEVDATFRKSDMAALKAFISRDCDELRRPYAAVESKYPRRTVFFASVNPKKFLHDTTGNTRWWTIPCTRLDTAHKIDMQQVWAEMYSHYQDGGAWHLTPDEVDALNGQNTAHEETDPIHDLIDAAFDWDSPPSTWLKPLRATQIAMSAGIDRPSKRDVNEASAYVTKQHGVKTKKVGKGRALCWLMPPMLRTGSPL